MGSDTAGRVGVLECSQAGKYLTFAIADEEFGVEILRVREIIGVFDITSVPGMPHYVCGVMNLRGQVISVIDLRARFGIESIDATDHTCVVVVETSHNDRSISTGIVVDRVCEVLDIAADQIEAAPRFGSCAGSDFVRGIGKTGSTAAAEDTKDAKDAKDVKDVKILLDIDAVLADMQIAGVSDIVAEAVA